MRASPLTLRLEFGLALGSVFWPVRRERVPPVRDVEGVVPPDRERRSLGVAGLEPNRRTGALPDRPTGNRRDVQRSRLGAKLMWARNLL